MTWLRIFRSLVAGIILVGSSQVTSAASAQEELTQFYQSGPWRVEHELIVCYLVNEQPENGATLKIMQMRNLGPDLVILLDSKPPTPENSDARFRIDAFSEAATIRFGGRNFGMMENSDQLLSAFRKGHQMDLLIGDKTVATFSLAGSAAAMRELQKCTDQLYDGPVRPPERKNMGGIGQLQEIGGQQIEKLLPNSPAQPISPENWIHPSDYPYHQVIEGNVRFTLTVDAGGRALDCQIVESSGESVLDELTCEFLIRRARFRPATNAEGEPAISTWSNIVRWRIPE